MDAQCPPPHQTRYLLPTASSLDRYPLRSKLVKLPDTVGVLTTASHRSIPQGIKEGRLWAVDNGVFTGQYDFPTFFNWYLPRLEDYRDQCLFVVCPDVVGNAKLTLLNFEELATGILNLELPIAYVAQNGQQNLPYPCADVWEWLFLGGTDAWRMSSAAAECIARAHVLKKGVHVGRVNSRKRFEYFQKLGVHSMDGTCIRYSRNHYTDEILRWTAQTAMPLPLSEYAEAAARWD